MGGSHISALLLAKHLDHHAIEVLILVHRSGPLTDYLLHHGVAFERVPESWILEYSARSVLRDGLRAIPSTLAMKRFLADQHVDIVHTNDNRMGTTWGPAARLAGCGLVWHQRTRPQLSRRMRYFAGLADHIVCISDYCSKAFRHPRFEDHLSVIQNPFTMPASPPSRSASKEELLAEIGKPAETRLIAFVANILPHKRPLVFVEAARRIADSCRHPVAFVAFGKAEGALYQRMLQRISELELDEHFHFLGFRDPIDRWIRGCDLLLSPSVEEGYGRTLIEGMIAKTPVVAADSGGYREIIQHGVNGLLAQPDNVEAFVEAALSVLSDPDYAASLADTALAQVLDALDVSKHVERISAVYRQVHSTVLTR